MFVINHFIPKFYVSLHNFDDFSFFQKNHHRMAKISDKFFGKYFWTIIKRFYFKQIFKSRWKFDLLRSFVNFPIMIWENHWSLTRKILQTFTFYIRKKKMLKIIDVPLFSSQTRYSNTKIKTKCNIRYQRICVTFFVPNSISCQK